MAPGRKAFHVKPIKRSYRNRGNVARNQINRKATAKVFRVITMSSFKSMFLPPRKRAEESILMTKILAYSAMKMRANPPPLYSTLKPETNSDSPSAKSNGEWSLILKR